jgi:hypothetical protein
MLTWLVDDPALVYILLAGVAIILAVLWWRSKQGKYLIGAGLAILLIVGVWLLSKYVPTDSKKIQHAVEDMSAGVRSRDLDRIFSHVAADFRHGSLDKKAFRQASDRAIREHDVTNVLVWDFQLREVSRQKRSAGIAFLVKPEGNWGTPARYLQCVADFVLESDGQWRMKGFELTDPLDKGQPVRIPGVD